jgi:hypothetical protein
MGRSSLRHNAEVAARSGGPPMPFPESLNDLGPILDRWPLMLKYDPESGELWWRYIIETHPNPQYLDKREYLATYQTMYGNKSVNMIRVDGMATLAARVVWLLHHREWPPSPLGRRDGNYLNDRIENLYLKADEPTLPRDRRPRRRPPGVARLYERWQAYARLPDGRQKSLGTYATEAEAIAARARWDEAQAAEAVGDLV